MGQTWRALMILSDGKYSSEILTISDMRDKVESSGMEFATTETVPEVRRDLSS